MNHASAEVRRVRALLVAGLAALIALPATAQQAEEATDLGTVQVTGSRISKVDAIAESPIYTVDRDSLIESGHVTLDHYLNTLPQLVPSVSSQSNNPSSNGRAFIDLRGLGAGRNLVLIDGRRAIGQASGGTIVDINAIPAALVERIEIITGGAAATYGADAVSGVVNIIMKKDFEGFALDSSFRQTEQDDGIERGASMTLGNKFAGGKGSAVFNGSFFSREAIYKGARSFAAQASSLTGTFPGGSYVTGTNTPSQAEVDNQFGAGLCNTNGGDAGFGFNPDGTMFCTGVLADGGARDVVGYTGPQSHVATAFFPDRFSYNFEPDNIMVLPLERYNLFGNFDLSLSQRFNPYVQAMFTNYNALQELAPTPAGPFTLPTTNPFIPAQLAALLASRTTAGATFSVNKRFNALGGRTGYNTHDVWQLTAGTKGHVAGTWNYDAYASYGRSVLNERQGGNVRLDRVNALLTAGDGGASQCAGGLNLFGAAPISAACQARIGLEAKNLTTVEQGGVEVEFTGNLVDLPAGPIQTAVGAGYRDVSFDFRPDSGLQPGLVAGFNEQLPVSGQLNYTDYFTEIYFPIVSGVPGVENLGSTLGLRSTDNNVFGVANTYKLTLDWTFLRGLRARGGFQRAIRSPNIAELYAPRVNNFPQASGQDPCNTGGPNAGHPQFGRNGANGANVAALCTTQSAVAGGPTFNQPAGQFRSIVGGNAALEEESADTWSFGLVATPLEKVSVTLDYYSIELEDVIQAPRAADVAQWCFNRDGLNPTYSNSSYWCQLFVRDAANGGIINMDQVPLNQSFVNLSGIDLTANFGLPIGPGQLNLALLTTYLLSFERQTRSDTPVYDYAGTISEVTGTSLPELRATFLTGFTVGNVSASVTTRYVDSMIHANNVSGGVSGANTGVKETYYADVGVDYKLFDVAKIRVGVINVANQPPRTYTPNVQANTDPSLYDVLGRTFFLGVGWDM